MKPILFALELGFLTWMNSAEKLSRIIYHLGWIFGCPPYLKPHPTIPIDLNGCDFQHAHVLLDPYQVVSDFLCIHFCMWTNNITYQSVFPIVFMDPGLQKKKMLNPAESFHFPDQDVCIAGRRDQMASGLKSTENQLGCMRGHFLPHFPGSLVRAGPGALSRTRDVNVKTSVWLEGPLDK